VSLLESFNNLGIPIEKEQINMVRNSTVQEVEMDIPKQHLAGHGYHTYTLLSPDGSVKLQFTHNVLGRNVYAVGALRAIRFLAVRKETKGKVFSMIDVLQ
jgi:4-hydroxy-tetrahydrodipicolinate reductase